MHDSQTNVEEGREAKVTKEDGSGTEELAEGNRRSRYKKGVCQTCGVKTWLATTVRCKTCRMRSTDHPRYIDGRSKDRKIWTRIIRARYPEKEKARRVARAMLARGEIKKTPCIKCGSPKSEMHHPDYSKPDLVEFLCPPCHVRVHHPKDDK
jgi:hypothetical protein